MTMKRNITLWVLRFIGAAVPFVVGLLAASVARGRRQAQAEPQS
jgi:hypothetical protein